MPLERGSFSFSMFDAAGELPENLPALFAAKKAGSLDSVTAEPQIGWVTGHHLLDTAIDEASAQLGGWYFLTLRQAVRKMPSSLLNAICRREEQAYMRANNLEYVSGKIRRQIREEALEKHLQKMPPALSGQQVAIDPHSGRIFAGASGRTQIDGFIDNFFQTTKVEPLQLTPGLLLEREFHITGASFPALSLTGTMEEEPSVGRDFLLWLWYYSETGGKVTHEQYGEFDLMIEGPLTFSGDGDARGAGEITLKKGESPLRSAEAKAALAVGKKLKKAKLTLTRANQIWSGTFDADLFTFGSFKLPEGEEMNEDEIFAERMLNLTIFREALTLYFRKFAETMTGMEFSAAEQSIRDWAKSREAV